jgi:hypothetical protein
MRTYLEGDVYMYFYKEDLINMIVPDKPDPHAAKVLQEALGGQFGEMRTMMQFSFQKFVPKSHEFMPKWTELMPESIFPAIRKPFFKIGRFF